MTTLKSKFVKASLGLVAGASMLLTAGSALAADTFTRNLTVGSRGADVTALQTKLGVTPMSGYFGPITKAAVAAYQLANNISPAVGYVGPLTRAVLNAGGTTTTTGSFAPAGCTSASGFSPVTGGACYAVGTTPTQTGPITVALATDNPASGSFIAPASGVAFAKYTFTGAGTVNSVKLMRTGISASTTLSNVYLYDGTTRITDGASIGSDNTVTFNALGGIFTVAGSKTITVVADTLVADYSLGFTLTSYTAGSTTNTVSIAGNQMYGASATLATVAVSNAVGTITEPGAGQLVWGGDLAVATRDVSLSRLALRQVGSIPSNEINNFKLLVDGVQVATTASLDANNYVTFNISPAKTLTTGTRVLKVMADVVGGSNRTVEFDLRGSYDLSAIDSQYGASVTPTASSFPFGPSTSTLSAGSLSVVKATGSASGNITNAANDQSFGTFTFTAYGEAVKVETLTVAFDWSGTDANADLRNVRVLANGAQVGSTTTVAAVDSHATGTSFTTNFLVYPGSPVTVEVRADVYDNDSAGNEFATDDTLQVGLVAGSSNAVRQSSLGSFNAPSAETVGNVLTIKTGTLSMAKTSNYPAQSTISPQTAYKIASYVLTGNSTEAVTVNTFDLDVAVGQVGGTPTIADVTDVYIKYGSNQTSIKSTVAATGNVWSPSFTLGVNENMTVEVYASFNTDFVATDTITASLEVTSQTAQSATSVGTGVVTGQVITMAAASITASIDASSPVATLIDDSGSVTTAAYKFVTVTDAYTITDVNVTLGSASAVSMVHLMDGATVLASKPAATDLTFSGLSVAVAAGTTKVLTVKLDLSPIGVSMGSSASSLVTTLDVSDTYARNSQGVSAFVSGSDAASTTSYAYKAVPTLSLLGLPSTTLAAGTQTLSKFSVSSGGTGTIAWDRISFDIVKTNAPTIASLALWNADTNTQVAGTVTLYDVEDTASCAQVDGSGNTCKAVFVPDAEEQVSGTKNYVLKATIAGTLVANDYITTSIPSTISTFAASTTSALVQAVGLTGALNTYAEYALTPSFVWSDMSAASHAVGTSDWSNNFLVKSLPLDSQTLTK